MDKAGYDAIMFQGASDRPVWIEIGDEGVVFHPAEDLWGLDTFQTEDLVKGWLKGNRPGAEKSGVICIGPAGENQVAFAVIENDYWRSAGRTGVGAVHGFQEDQGHRFWGLPKAPDGRPEAVKALAKELAAVAKDDKGVAAYKSMGTSMMVDMMNHAGCFPTEFWKRGTAEHKEKINAAALIPGWTSAERLLQVLHGLRPQSHGQGGPPPGPPGGRSGI